MKITVASLNPQKVKAVEESIALYPMLADAIVESISVDTGVADQPKSLEETVRGAVNRAKAAFKDTDYSIGLESGLIDVPQTKSGQMDLCVCAIYDGNEIHLGLSSAFEPPKKVSDFMSKGMNMSEATKAAGLTQSDNLGSEEGLVGILTHGRLPRLLYTKQALTTALIHLENAHLFKE
ncbi:MAG: inosine/xanthosine triphosphatase [Candidatus Paceibacterota bacterium]|jgi:inosine/xanthosine triphosphatase